MDTRLQNFWKESINIDNRVDDPSLRMAGQIRYNKERSKAEAQAKPKATSTANTALHNSITSKIKRLEMSTERMREENSDGQKVPEKWQNAAHNCLANSNDVLQSTSDMRPATSFTRSLLYNGLSVHGEGRYAYLKRRKTVVPDQKYLYPVLSSTEYGWKILEHAKLDRSPHGHATMSVIRDSFYRNSGIIFE